MPWRGTSQELLAQAQSVPSVGSQKPGGWVRRGETERVRQASNSSQVLQMTDEGVGCSVSLCASSLTLRGIRAAGSVWAQRASIFGPGQRGGMNRELH